MGSVSYSDLLLSQMTLKEKISQLSAREYWRTPSLPRLGIKALKMSDGPNGCRGEAIHASTKATCFPCGAYMGATFNTTLIKEMGIALGQDCKTKNVGVLLGPTMNIQRHPYGGRNFETFSEDPLLSGELAAAYVNGLQSEGVAATPKHFVCNECETDRNKTNSIVDEKTLRDIYLLPFQICVRKSDPWALMTAYNKVNGTYCSENDWLIQEVLRKEWGFKGLLMSDFEETYTEVESLKAGLNLEMPGPSRLRGDKMIRNVETGSVSEAEIDDNVIHVLELAQKVGMSDESAIERAVQVESISAVARRVAEEGMVLLKNDNATLPIPKDTQMKIAVFGAPATEPIIHGGGSSSLSPHYIVTPLEALRATYQNVEYRYGLPNFRKIPSAPTEGMKTASGEPGLDCFWYNGWTFGENQILHERLEKTRTLVIDPRIKGLESKHCTRMSYTLTPRTSGMHVFGITANGETRLYVDDEEVLCHPGFEDTKVEYIMQPGRFEKRASIGMEGGKEYHVHIDTLSTLSPPPPPPAFQIAPQATQVGFFENFELHNMPELEEFARSCDISIVFTGNTKEFESESFDREQLGLSLTQDSMVSVIAAASSKTIVVNQTGSPISMPWLNSVDAVLQCWFAGMEVGNAMVNIICGKVNPTGRLPTTFPKYIEDVPAATNFPADEHLDIRYAEQDRIGYRALRGDKPSPTPLFVFGHGFSYSEFEYSNFRLKRKAGHELAVEVLVDIRNTSSYAGKEVVQVYIDGLLKAFEKPMIEPKSSNTVLIVLDKYAFFEWDEKAVQKSGPTGAWTISEREYAIELKKDAATKICGGVWKVNGGDTRCFGGDHEPTM